MRILTVLIILLSATFAFAADLSLQWDAVAGADGYKLYYSVDNGITWGPGTDVGNATSAQLVNVPEIGLVLVKVSAYNTIGETVTEWQGAWYNHLWKPLPATTGLGIQ